MILCFGIYAAILSKCCLPGTTNKDLLSELVSTIDSNHGYRDKNNATSVSRLMNCDRSFPTITVSDSNVYSHDVGRTQTNIVSLAKDVNPDNLATRFTGVINLLDSDKKKAAVGALMYVIKEDKSLKRTHKEMFIKCMGIDTEGILSLKTINLQRFLSGLFLYTVLTNENKKGEEYLFQVKSNQFIDQFTDYSIEISSQESDTSLIPDGLKKYLKQLSEKYNCIPTILYKEALSPFKKYYVPNNIKWQEHLSDGYGSFRIHQISEVNISKLLNISRYVILSGTGGLGKSMMMRNLLLSSARSYSSIGLIPFFIPIKDYEISYETIADYVFDIVHNLWAELTKEKLENILKNNKALLLFDGLDEIHTSKLSDFTRKMNDFHDRYSGNAFIISSRPYSNFHSFSRSTVMYLLPFTKTQALELIDKYNYRSDSPKLQERFRKQFDTVVYQTHKGFSDNPLLLSIMMLTFEMDAEVPLKKYLFYQEAYTVLARRHDAMKDGYSRRLETGWSEKRFSDYFAYFCAKSYSDGVISFTLTEMDTYFRDLVRKYAKKDNQISEVSLDSFIYDLTNNLCLMYQDGTKYGFTHRSFQEYFCARYFNAQLDELLTAIIPIFDRDDRTKNGDSAIEMLFDMKPKAVEKYLIIPYLRGLIDKCEKSNRIWSFLKHLYNCYEVADGTATVNDDFCKPRSNLYNFILNHYNIESATLYAEDISGIKYFLSGTMVYREDTCEDDWEENLPWNYEDNYGEPEITGYLYEIEWDKAENAGHEFIASIESSDNAFMKEYVAIKELLQTLETKNAKFTETASIFDMME